MRIAQIVEPGHILLREVDMPKLEPGKVLVRMEKVALCGSDLPHFGGEREGAVYPLEEGRNGHECLGVVVESDDGGFHPGDRVLVLPPSQNGLAEYMQVSPMQLLALPGDMDADVVLMTQLLGTVIHCVRQIGNVVGGTVALVGQGPVGLLFSAMMRNLGAKWIVGIDRLAYRLKVSERMGATHVVDASRVDPIAVLSEITQGKMADLAVEAVGTAEAGNLCMDLVRHGGTVIQFGVPRTRVIGWEVEKLLRKELRVIASVGPDRDRDYGLALDFIVQGRVDVRPMITHHVPFEEVQRAFDLAYGKKDGAVKVVVEFQ